MKFLGRMERVCIKEFLVKNVWKRFGLRLQTAKSRNFLQTVHNTRTNYVIQLCVLAVCKQYCTTLLILNNYIGSNELLSFL